MRIIETKVYLFNELNEDAKEKAIEANRYINVEYGDWYDPIHEDCKEALCILGIEVDKIYFSGFYSQGDGACFEGNYCYSKGAYKAICKEYPNDTELQDIAKRLQDIQKRNFYGLEARVRQYGMYYHENSTSIDVTHVSDRYVDEDTEEEISDILRYAMRWIYSKLETEYECYTSDSFLAEYLQDSEYEFTEKGERI